MYKVGDTVYVENSAEHDCHYKAWPHIQNRKGRVRKVQGDADNPQAVPMCSVEFDAPFAGGVDCHGICLPAQGQFVMANHLSLCFEDSRTVNTVPQITTEGLGG